MWNLSEEEAKFICESHGAIVIDLEEFFPGGKRIFNNECEVENDE